MRPNGARGLGAGIEHPPPDISSTTSTVAVVGRNQGTGQILNRGVHRGIGRAQAQLPLLRSGRGSHHRRAERPGELQRQRADATRPGDHDHGLTPGQLRGRPEQMPCSEPLDQQRQRRSSSSPSGIGKTVASGATAYSA